MTLLNWFMHGKTMLLNCASQATVSCTCHLDALIVINIAAGTRAATLSDVYAHQVLVIVD